MLRPIQPFVEYAINQDYIAEFLCINKDKPKLQCNGKCHLIKQIEKQQEQSPFSAFTISMENYPIGFITICDIPFRYSIESTNNNSYFYKNLYTLNVKKSIFQPPIL